MKRQNLLLLGVIVVAFFLRILFVTKIPPALSWDEVSIGYNAYSILKTGRDEHGKFLPLDAFVSYGDYKPPLAVYATIPFVAVFGLGELAVRLPSVVFGTMTILFIYLLATELFEKNEKVHAKTVGIVSSILFAISPWHINLSRAGFEANIGLFFIIVGIWAFFRARTRPRGWLVAFVPFVASIYTFNSTRYFAPLIGVTLLVYFRREIWKARIWVFAGFCIAGLLMMPILPHLLSKEARLRYVEVNIFSDASVVATSNARMDYDDNSFVSKIIDNRRVGYIRSFFVHYLDNFLPDYLFIKGDGNPKFSIQDVGQLYIVDLPFLLMGAYVVFLMYPSVGWLLSFWLMLSIVPAAVARETPHALRTLNALPVFTYATSLGLMYGVSKSKKKLLLYIVLGGYVACVGYYLHNYYVHYPRLYASEWQYGYKDAILYAQSHQNDYDTVYLSEVIGRAYMYTLFYTKYDPNDFMKTKKSYFDAAGFYHVDGFGKYVFPKSVPSTNALRTLYIYPPGSQSQGSVIKKEIRLPNGQTVLVAFEKG